MTLFQKTSSGGGGGGFGGGAGGGGGFGGGKFWVQQKYIWWFECDWLTAKCLNIWRKLMTLKIMSTSLTRLLQVFKWSVWSN